MNANEVPVLVPENYEQWRNNMLLHLEAISDEMIYVLENVPIVIRQLKLVTEVSDGRREGEDLTDEESQNSARRSSGR